LYNQIRLLNLELSSDKELVLVKTKEIQEITESMINNKYVIKNLYQMENNLLTELSEAKKKIQELELLKDDSD
jgi:hypothetical protein